MRLKTVKRAGWQRCGVEACESVADHTFGVALLALILPNAAGLSVNRDRCVALALVHDLAESIVGDITPHDNVAAEEKSRRERLAMKQLCDELGNRELLELWEEFEAADTPEAKLVRDLDLIEMALQAKRYRLGGVLDSESAEQFIESARTRLRSPQLGPTLDLG